MNLSKKNIYDLCFVLLMIAFIVLKTKDIHNPYFWDELGVYAPAALHMKDAHTIGLMPADLEPLFSRGHPLFFTFCNALVFNIFGDNLVVGHIFSLIIACCTLLVFYCCSANLFSKKTAFIASLFLCVQPIFYANACIVLPEMMLTLFTIPALYGLIKKNWLLYILSASLAMLVKESAIILPAAALLFLFIEAIIQKDFFSLRCFRCFIFAAIPLFVFGIFLIIQKIQNGWFFFPEHIGYIHFTGFGDTLINILKDLFIRQGKWFLTIFLVLGIVLSYKQIKKQHQAIFVIAGFFL